MIRTVKFLKKYNEYREGDVADFSNNVAFGLVDSGVAKYADVESAIKTTKLGKTKAFKKSPAESSLDYNEENE
ncbi:MAG: hypothetical protein WDA09_03750 [Bacteriovoracaceae bacterium]